ncbi:MAG: hypothetical protein AAGD10_00035 [Myxococcota bacterium]
MSYRFVRAWLPRLLPAYVLAGMLASAAPGFEVFPFFCWFLFPITPTVETRYELQVEALAGEALDEPTPFRRLHLVAEPHAMDAWTAIQALGRALEAQDEAEVRRLRRRLEDGFLPGPSRYAVMRVIFDPVERWRGAPDRHRRRLARFETEGGCREVPWPR